MTACDGIWSLAVMALHLKAGTAGLAIMMASRWKRPSATKMMASVSAGTTGAVQPST